MVADIWPSAAKGWRHVQKNGEAGVGHQRGGAPANGWDGLAAQAERRGSLALAMPTSSLSGSVKA